MTAYSNYSNNDKNTIIIQQPKNNSNGIGMAGFVLSLIALFLGWIPIIGWILWVLGLVLSFVGLFSRPRGFAIAGLVISLIGVFLFIFVFASLAILSAVA